jgi:hypothetical protein
MTKPLALTLAVFLDAAAVHASADWPQWQGPTGTASTARRDAFRFPIEGA